MTISVWRYSHLTLALSSFILLALASITGIILAFEPVTGKLQPYRTGSFHQVTLAQTLPALRKAHPGISELSVDDNQFVQIKGSDANGEKLLAYVDPQTGKILGTPTDQSEFFKWVTAFHRSLFIHETGRFFIGLTAFLLLLITISGTMLIIQRQRGVKHFFKKIAKDNFAQFYHVVLGRWSLIPIFIIALTGTYLSLARFGFIEATKSSPKIDFEAIRSSPEKKATEFAVFKDIKLAEVESVEFPFSEDVEDYYTLKLKTREVAVNQVTGDILAEVKYPASVSLTNLSLNLHTGRASSIWAVILAIASANILFFIYSGFAITIKRRANRSKNKYTAAESEFIILVGSENGNTFRFAQAVHQQLIKAGKKSFITELNSYATFPNAQHLLVLTATYGLGDAPTNAEKFETLLQKYPQAQPVKYSVLGFGSHAYPDFCRFAFEVNNLLAHREWATPLIDVHTVNDRSPDEFSLWAEAWSQQSGIKLNLLPEINSSHVKGLRELTVSHLTPAVREDGTFMISFNSKRKLGVTSGDLLAIYPGNDHRERLYSIGVINNEIRLSVRLHPKGLGSTFLHRLKPGKKINAKLINNAHFHFPKSTAEVVMISNGTGIAPFLGMISQNQSKIPCYLYGGFRERSSYEMYETLLEESRAAGKIQHIQLAFSREGNKQYVSDLIKKDADWLADVLSRGGVIMICGSLTMQKDVMDQLENICQAKMGVSISLYQSLGQIRSDCY
jgi:sulfite reductase (NADPH) flavoprotein alpha-component